MLTKTVTGLSKSDKRIRSLIMKYIKLNQTDITASCVALGTDSIGTYIDEEKSRAILDKFTELGGTLIDTAVSYADWEPGETSRSEKLIGRWMKDRNNRHELIIATKGGCPHHTSMHTSRLSREEVNSDMDKSLINLKTDYVDVYFLHRDDESKPVEEIAEILCALVKNGKARYAGLSNWKPYRIDLFNEYCRNHNLPEAVTSQIQFGLARPNLENMEDTLEIMQADSYDYYSKRDMSLFAFTAQSKGYFAKIDKNLPLSPKAETRYKNEENDKIYEKLKALKEEYSPDIASLTIGILSCNPNFTTIPIAGCKNTEQVISSMSGADLKIPPEIAENIIKSGLIVHN